MLARAGVYLEPNRGQSGMAAAFLARTPAGAIAAGPDTMAYLRRDGSSAAIVFEGASNRARALPEQLLGGVSHYVQDRDPARWVWDVPHYGAVRYLAVYPGIDLVYRAAQSDVEFDFLVGPGADPAQIRLRVPAGVRLDASGALAIGGVTLRPPVAWQTTGGKRNPVLVRFALRRRRVSFQLGSYDPALRLTIDPIVRFATFLGGSGNDVGTRVLSGSDGAIYTAGSTMSVDFPASLSPDNPLNRPGILLRPLAYIARLKADASAFDWSLFIGGPGHQGALALKQDAFGNIYLLGSTTSPNFPVTPGTLHTSIDPSMTDLFLVKLDAQTGHIKASTFLGVPLYQNRLDGGAMLAIDIAGGIYVGGGNMPDGDFKPTPGAFQVATAPAFVLRLNSAMNAAVYATNWGLGTIAAMEVDSGGNLLIGGTAFGSPQSGGPPFPAVNPLPGFNQKPLWPAQAYLARLNPTGTAVTFASLLHGDGRSSTMGDLKLLADGSYYVAGYTDGTRFPLVNPLTLNPEPPAPDPGGSGAGPFLARISADNRTILQSTVFYGPAYTNSSVPRIALQRSGFPCLTGVHMTVAQQTPGGLVAPTDSYTPVGWPLSCVDQAGAAMGARTGLPAIGSIAYNDIASTADGALLFTGSTGSAFVTTPGVVQPLFGGQEPGPYYGTEDLLVSGDAFLLRVSLDNPAPSIQMTAPDSLVLDNGTTGACTADLYGSGFAYGATATFNGQPATGTFVDSGHAGVSFDCSLVAPGDNHIVVTLPAPGGGSSDRILPVVNGPPSAVSVSPGSVTQGAAETKLVISATNLSAGSVLYWNGSARPATFVRSAPSRTGHFELLLEPPEMAQPAGVQITVSNPGPGGGVSAPVTFTVQPSSGAGVPVLYEALLIYGGPVALGPQVSLFATGITATAHVFWDGAEVPVASFTSTGIAIQPPAGDLSRLGAHQVYAVDGAFRSMPARVLIGRSVTTSSSAYDPLKNRLYILGSLSPYASTVDLLVFDATTGSLLSSLPSIVQYPRAVALSADGHYLYVAGSADNALAPILRYNTETNAVDLQWQAPAATGQTTSVVNSIVTPPDSPETLIVSTTDNLVLIFDRDRARPFDAATVGFPGYFSGGYPIFFASATRVYGGIPGPSSSGSVTCWMWLDYDGLGFSGGQSTCAAEPPEMHHDNGVTYLTDGARTYVTSLPWQQPPASSFLTASGRAIDLGRRHAWQYSFSNTSAAQLLDYDMDARQLQLKLQMYTSSYTASGKPYPMSNGAVLLVTQSSIVVVP
jgi:DNA-binding beta-propeller fold protein YncE